MRAVDDPRCPRAKKHDLAEVLTCLVVGYLTGHTGLRRCHDWCCRHLNWLRQGMELKNGIASVSTIFRLVSTVDETLFLCSFMEWIGEILDTRGLHIAIDGKALRASLSKVKGGHTPMLLNAIDTATGLVLAQLPIQNKDCEIMEIPELLKLLDIHNSVITTDAIGTQTNIMQQIVDQGAHFVMMIKKNQPTSYDEITRLFSELETDAKLIREGKSGYHHYDLRDKYYFCKNFEKNRDRNETRLYETCSEPSYITKTHKEWPFVKTIGLCKQLRILRISNNDGTDITPDKVEFIRSGTRRQPKPETGDPESADYQIVGMISDMQLSPKEIGEYKRNHWRIENTLHHVLDDTFREDRSPAKKSKNNLALIRKFAYNILRLVSIQCGIKRPNTEIMDRLADDFDLLGAYIFKGIKALS